MGLVFLKDKKYLLELKVKGRLPKLTKNKRKRLEEDVAHFLNLEYRDVSISQFKTSTIRYVEGFHGGIEITKNSMYSLLFVSIHSKNKLEKSKVAAIKKLLPTSYQYAIYEKIKNVKIHALKRNLTD